MTTTTRDPREGTARSGEITLMTVHGATITGQPTDSTKTPGGVIRSG